MNNVLVIDDDFASGILIKDILTSVPPMRRVPGRLKEMFGARAGFAERPDDFSVTLATSGMEGVEMFAKAVLSDEPVMLAFVDLTLKDINGLDAGYRMRKLDGGIKIVFFSGRDFSDAELASDLDGKPLLKSVFYLQKPFASSEIRQYALALCEERKAEWEMRGRMEELLSVVKKQKERLTAGC